MSRSRRVQFRSIVAIAVIAGALGACGVKGELEPPPAAGPALNAAPRSGPSGAAASSEQSATRVVPYESMLPSNPPEEWSKSGAYQSSGQAKSRAKQKSTTDEPFFLDPIL